jgi:translation elongation factor EF-Tu-like GTPase
MVKIKATIKLYKNKRKTPFQSGYKPLFNFIDEMKTSGKIELTGRDKFYPGEEDLVYITFISEKYLGENFGVGKRFLFGEGTEPIGEGVVKEILFKE